MQEQIEITVKGRTSGKHFSRLLRSNREIPAIVYGPKIGNLTCSLNENDAIKYSSHHYDNVIFVLKSDEPKLNKLQVLKKDISWHPLSRRPLHIDFYALDMSKKLRVHVEIRYVGRAEGQKEGGVLNVLRRDIEVECLPTSIPDGFEVDISGMGLNDVLHVSDIKIPDGVKVITHAEEAIASVSVPKEEELTPAVAAPADAAAAAPAEGAAAAPAEGGDKAEEKK